MVVCDWLVFQVSFTGSDLLTHGVVKEIAAKHEGATTASVLINWGIARGYSVIPKSATPGAY